MKYYYARVSTEDQHLDRQLEDAKQYNVDEVFSDKQSGKNFDRKEYQRLKKVVKAGDEVFVKEIDRLGRTKDGIKEEMEWFRSHGVKLRIGDIPTTMIDFGDQDWIYDMVNNIMIEVLCAIAEQERVKTMQRQREGYDAMKVVNGRRISAKTGRPCGRPRKVIPDFEKYYERYRLGLINKKQMLKEIGISERTWDNRMREARDGV